MAVDRRPVAELADVIVAPARDSAHAGERTGVVAAGGDRGHAAGKPGDGDRGLAVGRRPVPELTVVVAAQALDPAGAGERAGVVETGGDRGHAAGEAGDGPRGMAVGPRPVPELAVTVVAPARDSARAGERAGVAHADGDRGHTAGEAGDGHRGMAVGR